MSSDREGFPSVDISRVAIVVIEDIFVFIVMRLRYARTEGFRAEKILEYALSAKVAAILNPSTTTSRYFLMR